MTPPSPSFLETLRQALTAAPEFFVGDLLRYVLAAGAVYLIVNVWLVRHRADLQIRAKRPDGRQIRREVLSSLRSIAVFAVLGTLVFLEMLLGISQAYADPLAHGPVWMILSFIVLVIAHDAWFYWTHRLMHRPRWYRRFHSLHHKSNAPTPWTAYAFNICEAAVHGLFLPVILLVLPVPYIVLFVWGIHQIVRNAIGHCGVEIFPARRDGRPLFDWLTTVTHHDLHHARAGSNFGLYFTWWDRWMGTENPDYHARFAAVVQRRAKRQSGGSPAVRQTGDA